MQLYKILVGTLFCLLPVVTGQSSDADVQTSAFGSLAEMDVLRSLFGRELCLDESCGVAVESSSQPDSQTENTSDKEIPQPEYPEETTDNYPGSPQPDYPEEAADNYPGSPQPEYPEKTQDDYPEDFSPTNGHSNAENVVTSLCYEFNLVIKEIEAKHPEFEVAKYKLLNKLKTYSSVFSSELAKSSSEHVITKILNIFILIADKVKADFKAEITEKSKYLKPKVPVVEDVVSEEIAEEEFEPPYPPFVGSVRGIPGKDYPAYSEVPITSFSCADKKYIPGFYADIETGCQVFHVCYEHRRESFLCPVGTLFNQPILACDYWYSSNCSLSVLYYDVNVHNKEISKQADEVESTIGALITTIIGGEESEVSKVHVKEYSKLDKQDLGDLVKFLPVKATVVEFPEVTVPKVQDIPGQVDEVASKIVDQLVATTTHLASKTRQVLKTIPEPDYKIEDHEVFKQSPDAESTPLKVKVATKAKKVATTKIVAPIIAKGKIATVAKVAVPVAKAKTAKAAAVKMAIPIAAKVKMAAAIPVVKVTATKVAVPVAAKAKLAAAVPMAKAAATKVAVPVVAKMKKAAAVSAAKAAAAKVAVPVAAKVKKAAAVSAAKVAVPVAAKVKKAAAVSAAKAAAAKVAIPVAAKAKKSAVPIVKTKLGKAATIPVKGKMFALPLAKKLAVAGVPMVKAKKLPLVLAGVKPAVSLAKAKAVAISPLTKKALALGYMKLLKAKKLAVIG